MKVLEAEQMNWERELVPKVETYCLTDGIVSDWFLQIKFKLLICVMLGD